MRKKYVYIAILIIGVFSTINVSGDFQKRGIERIDLPPLFRVYAEVEYSWLVPRSIQRWRDPIERKLAVVNQGSGFVIRYEEHYYFVSAAHIIEGISFEELDVEDKIDAFDITTSRRIRFGCLSIKAERTLFDRESDVFVAMLKPEEIEYLYASSFKLPSSPKNLTRRSEVYFWGFPSVANPQVEKGLVADIEHDYFVLNRPVESGYSGGPVFSENDNNLLGMVVRSSERQTRCVPISKIHESIRKFRIQSEEYFDGLY